MTSFLLSCSVDKPKKTIKVKLTPEIRNKLIYEHKRTGIGGSALLRGQRGKHPDGLHSHTIDGWRNGKIQSAKSHYLEWVLDRYENYQPDPNILELTKEIRNFLKAERNRTGTTPAKLLENCTSDIPDGFHSHTVVNWMQGVTQTVNRSQLDFVLREYAKLSDDAYRIKLTKAKYDQLMGEVKRTGCGATQIMRLAKKPLPEGLNARKIALWFKGNVKTVRRDQWERVMETFASLPDIGK